MAEFIYYSFLLVASLAFAVLFFASAVLGAGGE